MAGLEILPNSNSKTKKPTESSNQDMATLLHDIRTHLSPIKTYSEMLISQISGPLNEKQEKMILSIQRCVDKLENLTRDASHAIEQNPNHLH